MKLKEFDFDGLVRSRYVPIVLAVKKLGGDFYEEPSVFETLRALPREYAELEIVETRWYYDTFVIELSDEICEEGESDGSDW